MLETGKILENELDVAYPDGTTRSVLVIKFPMGDDPAHPTGVGAINIDNTDRRAAEQEVRR